MNKTKIEWADSTWNPVTGCLHGCDYCYARRIARRFCHDPWNTVEGGINHYVGAPMYNEHYKVGKIDPYPYGFDPTFHRYRLGEPARKTKPQNIFVCSMADLFGDWVPDEWIKAVFEACEAAPQHTYLFLTKNPKRYNNLACRILLPVQHWYGFSYTGVGKLPEQTISNWRNFVSIEPLLAPIDTGIISCDNMMWVIIGAETGNRKNKVVPKKQWIDAIVEACDAAGTPVFMKDSLLPIMGEENMRREFPWNK